jgi:hypothetical protein
MGRDRRDVGQTARPARIPHELRPAATASRRDGRKLTILTSNYRGLHEWVNRWRPGCGQVSNTNAQDGQECPSYEWRWPRGTLPQSAEEVST